MSNKKLPRKQRGSFFCPSTLNKDLGQSIHTYYSFHCNYEISSNFFIKKLHGSSQTPCESAVLTWVSNKISASNFC